MVKVIRVEKRKDDLAGLENRLNEVFQEIHDKSYFILDVKSFEGKIEGVETIAYMILVDDNKEE